MDLLSCTNKYQHNNLYGDVSLERTSNIILQKYLNEFLCEQNTNHYHLFYRSITNQALYDYLGDVSNFPLMDDLYILGEVAYLRLTTALNHEAWSYPFRAADLI